MAEVQVDEAALRTARKAYILHLSYGHPASDVIVALREAIKAYLAHRAEPVGAEDKN